MEYKFKGTPGPWHPVEYAGHISIQDKPFYGEKDLLDADNIGYEPMKANGHLAAAAPELLEACIEVERVLTYIRSEYNFDFMDEDIRCKLWGALASNRDALKKALNL